MQTNDAFEALLLRAKADLSALERLSQYREAAWASRLVVRAALDKLAAETLEHDAWTPRDPRLPAALATRLRELTEPLLIATSYARLQPLRAAVADAAYRETAPALRYAPLRHELEALGPHLDALFAWLDRDTPLRAMPFDGARAEDDLRRYLQQAHETPAA